MNGDEHSTAKERLDKIDGILDEYESSLGLPSKEHLTEATEWLNKPISEIKKMSSDDCGDVAYTLSQFAFHVQRAYNREVSRVKWAEGQIKASVSEIVNQYQGISYEERKNKAIFSNEFIQKLEAIRVYADERSTRLNFLATRIWDICQTLIELQRTRRKKYDG